MFHLNICVAEISSVIGIFYFGKHCLAHCIHYMVAIGSKLYAVVSDDESAMVSTYIDVFVLQKHY